MKEIVIDRFEDGGLAVLELGPGESLSIPRQWLPADARAGDVVTLSVTVSPSESSVAFAHDRAATERRSSENAGLRAGLTKGPSGDIAL